jgi:hypothetical protein
MNMEQVKEIANAVLYEGYLLYPYRRSAIKNRQRWTFGVVYPREYSEANGSIEPWTMHTECLVAGQADTSLDVTVRFLHLLMHHAPPQQRGDPGSKGPGHGHEPDLAPTAEGRDEAPASQLLLAESIDAEPWEEGMEREVCVADLSLGDLVAQPRRVVIAFPGGIIDDPAGGPAAAGVREQQPLSGAVTIAATPTEPLGSSPQPARDGGPGGLGLFKLSVHIENTTPGTGMLSNRANAALQQSFVATHTIMQVRQGAFISLLDPPAHAAAAAQACHNVRTWPVLVGNEGDHDTLLSSPIILYDYPQIAPESPGPLFDGTEIDEILTLRIMTLTDEEKEEIRHGDARAREILERTEGLSPEQFMKLHGAIRSLRPATEGGEA